MLLGDSRVLEYEVLLLGEWFPMSQRTDSFNYHITQK